jgi:hemerythrin-like metal-binding protein
MDARVESAGTAARGVAQLAEMLSARAARGEAIDWSPTLSVGVASIDGQHRVLVAYINQLSSAIARQQSGKVLGQVLVGLEGYTRLHFHFEERLFERLSWTEGHEHAQAHRLFESQLADFRARFAGGDTQLAGRVLAFMVRWLAEHILIDDMAYSAFLQANKVH